MDSSDAVLQEIKEKFRTLKLPKETRKISLIMLILLGIDIIASLLTPHLQSIDFFSGKSEVRILSDLLFFEGAAIFTVGSFLGFVTRDFRSRLAVILLLIILGLSFLGSSMMISALFSDFMTQLSTF